ncbi:PKD domain-containing protein [Haloarcula brevis]|uniref:PKD domain-containing protein n=1 Tax=Haloarcula brevis TaxID=3111453 RepID=UPI00300EB60C
MIQTIQTAARPRRKVLAIGLVALVVVSGIGVGVPNSSPVQNTSAQTTSETFSLSSESPATVAPGNSFTVTYTIENTGSTALNSLGLQATEVPNGFTITSISSADATFISDQQNAVGFPTISPGENATVTFTVQANATISGNRTLTVEAANGFGANEVARTQNTTVSVNQQPTADAGNSQLVDEETNVTLNASGSSDPDGDPLSYNWSQTAGPSVDLNGATSVTPSFTAPATGSETTLTFRVAATDGNGGIDADTVNITVQPLSQPNFSVNSLNAPNTATRDDSLTVSATISNNGDEVGTQTVQFRVDTNSDGTLGTDEILASQEVSLGAEETTEVTFEDLETSSLEPGDYTHGIFSANDSETATIAISSPPDPANFNVDNLTAPTTVTQGNALTVSTAISNNGDQAGTQIVQFRVDTNGDGTLGDGEVLSSQEVSIDGGETAEVTFENLTTDSLAPGDYTHGVFTADDRETATITISSPPNPANFSVDNLNAPTTATQGDSLTVSADISNEGEQAGTQTVNFGLDTDRNGTIEADETLASQNISLDGGETTEVTFENIDTNSVEPGDYTHEIVTGNDSETATITISSPPEPANFSVENLDAPSSVTQGETITVSAEIANEGEQADTQTIEFRLDADGNGTIETEETLASQNVSLNAGETTEITFDGLETDPLTIGDYTHGVFTANHSETARITISSPPEPANFSVENLTAPAAVTQGDSLTVSIEISNEGDQADTQTIEFRIDTDGSEALEADEILASQNVSLDAGETTEVAFENLDTSSVEPGDYTHGVITSNDSETATITISSPPEPANFSVSGLNAPTATTQGDSLTVSAEISNEGDRTGIQTVQFRVDTDGNGALEFDEVLASENVSLNAEETTEVTFESLDTDPLAPGNYTHGIVTDDDSEIATILIEAANQSPTADAMESQTVEEGASVTLNASGSSDPDGDTLSYTWTQTTGPPANLSSPSTETPSFIAPEVDADSDLVFEVTVSDGNGGTATDAVTITVQNDIAPEPDNRSPDADAGADQTVDEHSTVQLYADGSTDPDGDILTYNWTQTAGPSVTLSESLFSAPTFTAPTVTEETTLTFQTRARDGNGGTDTDTVNITVRPVNDPPSADAGPDQTVDSGTAVTLNASASTDPEGDTLSYEWEPVSRANVTLSEANTATPSFNASDVDVETILSFEVTVSDGNGATDIDTVDVRIEPVEQPAENQPPVADAGPDQTVPGESTATLDATGSSDPDGDSLAYTWTQTSGPDVPLSDGSTATPSFTSPAVDQATDLTFEVVVSDGQGETDTENVTVTVEPVTEGEAFFAVTNLSVPDKVTQGDSLTISANIINTGDAEGTQLVEARVDANNDETQEVIQTESVTLASGENTTVTTTRTIPANLSTGQYTGGLFTSDSNQTTSVTVISKASPEEKYTRDEIAKAKYGYNFSELSNETARQVEELYLRQPFAKGAQPEDVKTREEIAEDRYGKDFGNLSRETTIEIQSDFDAQFGDTGANTTYTRDEISRAKYYGYNFSELSTETAGQVEELYNRQPFADGISPSNIQTREEIANEKYGLEGDELSRETRLELEQTYHEQFKKNENSND